MSSSVTWSNEAQVESKSFVTLYIQAFSVCVAYTLGSGILGLPLDVYQCGFYPFVIIFSIIFSAEITCIHFFAEILQIGDAALQEARSESVEKSHDVISSKTIDNLPNLHNLGTLFLPMWLVVLSHISIFANIIFTLVSYGLAGSEAVGQLSSINYRYLIPAFIWGLSFVTVFAYSTIQKIISILTFGKALVFVITTVVGIVLGSEINRPYQTNWAAMNDPILMGSVALGGIPFIMPMLYENFRGHGARPVKGFKYSLYAGLLFCFILNIMWTWSVLTVVPQFDSTCRYLNSTRHGSAVTVIPSTTAASVTTTSAHVKQCNPAYSLEAAKLNGMISTIPFTEMVKLKNPSLLWVSDLIQLFVVVSVTVAFLTNAAALYHSTTGVVNSILSYRRSFKDSSELQPIHRKNSRLPFDIVWHQAAGFLSFGVVFIISVFQPKGFVKILDKGAASCSSFFCGPILFAMYYQSQQPRFQNLSIPLPTPTIFRPLMAVILIFYAGIIIYMIIVTAQA